MFLKNSGGSINRIKLVKLMYLMDREALLARVAPVTNDAYYSLPHGPVPSNVYNLIRHGAGEFWPKHIDSPTNKLVLLVSDPGTTSLNRGGDRSYK